MAESDSEVLYEEESVPNLVHCIPIQIQGKYVSSNSFMQKSSRCALHKKISTTDIPKLVRIICENVPDKQFIKSFDIQSIDTPKTKFYAICFVDTVIEQITNN